MQQQVWQPECVIFVGVQASGKSTFYRQRFFATHLRINLDMLKTRHRETELLRTCLAIQQHLVVDNTNLTIAERTKYIAPARRARFRVAGYFFPPDIAASLARNAARTGRERIPDQGIYRAAKHLQPPTLAEGFDALYQVRIAGPGTFEVRAWTPGE